MTKKTSMERRRRLAKQRDIKSQEKKARRNRLLTILVVIAALLLVSAVVYWQFTGDEQLAGDAQEDPCAGDEPRALTEVPVQARNNYYAAYPEMEIDPAADYEACIRTGNGDIRLRLFAEQAPLAVNSFVFLASQGYYDGTTFHRVIQDFMAQAGDPTGTGTGGPGYAFEDEVASGLTFDRSGLLAMANTGQPVTNGSQFFITYQETPWLNGRHTIFGEIIEGQDVLDALTRVEPDPTGSTSLSGDVIERINIIER